MNLQPPQRCVPCAPTPRLEAQLQKAKAAFDEAVKSRDKVITDDTEVLIEESRAFQAT